MNPHYLTCGCSISTDNGGQVKFCWIANYLYNIQGKTYETLNDQERRLIQLHLDAWVLYTNSQLHWRLAAECKKSRPNVRKVR
jgi:hypothetical protein